MEISLVEIWKECDFDETLEEYVKGRVDEILEEIKGKVGDAIKKQILSVTELVKDELKTCKAFAKCSDAKINEHLLSHEKEKHDG